MSGTEFLTVGYGGSRPAELVEKLVANRVELVVDVRLRPNRASMGAFVKAKSPEKGIEALLARGGIAYRSMVELGNPFVDEKEWEAPYTNYLSERAEALLAPLLREEMRFALMCAERDVVRCHRLMIARELEARGWKSYHLR